MSRSLFAPLLAAALAACGKPAAPAPASSAPAAAAATPALAASAAPASPAPAAGATQSAVAKVVFLDKADACECTQKAIDASWKALEAAFAKKGSRPVERIHMDQQPDQADLYRVMQPIVAVPALYFLDARGAFVAGLQGELTEAQLAEKL